MTMDVGLSDNEKEDYIKSKGWYTFKSSFNWLNDVIMDDICLDRGGLSLHEAYIVQRRNDLRKHKYFLFGHTIDKLIFETND